MGRNIMNLNRPHSKFSPKKRFIIFSEGKNTEPEYFREYARSLPNSLVKLEIYKAAGAPTTIAIEAVNFRKKMQKTKKGESHSINDEVWAIFDRDDHENYERAINDCIQGGVYVARSIPCFEFWLILHYEEYERCISHHEAQKYLKTICSQYDRRGRKIANSQEIMSRITDAENRAQNIRNRRAGERNSFYSPYTDVDLLTKKIREAHMTYKKI
jgi:hypothetical protein